jgi:hypothetical protein
MRAYSVIGVDVLEKSSNVRRKTLVAREDLVNRVSIIAKEQGCSLFELVNNLFQLVIISNEASFSLNHVVEECKVLKVAKNSGFILGLERLWYEMADVTYKKDKKASLKSWFDSGIWFASRYATGESFSFEPFKDNLAAFTWNAPEFELEQTDNKMFVKITSPRFTEAYTFLFASFLIGALENFGYSIINKEISRGIIRLDAMRTVDNGTA